MTLETALKLIAFYMGYRDAFNPCDNPVGKNHQLDKYLSLDELVPVWDKLGVYLTDYEFQKHMDGWCFEGLGFNKNIDKKNITKRFPTIGADGETLQIAAALATAKAIDKIRSEQG